MTDSVNKSYTNKDQRTNGKKKENRLFKYLVLAHIVLLVLVVIWFLASGYIKIDSSFLIITGVVLGIISLRILFSILILLKTNSVRRIDFKKNELIIKYSKWLKEDSVNLFIQTTEIELEELRNEKSFFIGLRIKIKDQNSGEKYHLDDDWSNQNLENIYTEFKQMKNELIPEVEKETFKQLQIMNNTYKE